MIIMIIIDIIMIIIIIIIIITNNVTPKIVPSSKKHLTMKYHCTNKAETPRCARAAIRSVPSGAFCS